MGVLVILFSIIALCVIALASINIYLISLVRKLERELDEWEVPW